MQPGKRPVERPLTVGDAGRFTDPRIPSLLLRVPARPEALGIVRLVLMSCGAAAGLSLKEIIAISREVADSFTDVLVAQPEAKTIVIRAQSGASAVDVAPVRVASTGPQSS